MSKQRHIEVSSLFTSAEPQTQQADFRVLGQQEDEAIPGESIPDKVSSVDDSRQTQTDIENNQIQAQQQSELLQALAQARQEGLEAGLLQASQEQALQQSDLREVSARLAASIDVLAVSSQALWAHAQQEVLSLAIELAQRLLNSELQQRPESLLEMTRALLSEVHAESHLRLRFNPEDLSLIESQRASLGMALDSLVEIQLLADTDIERGGCVIEADDRELDGRISNRLRLMSEALQQNMGASHAD